MRTVDGPVNQEAIAIIILSYLKWMEQKQPGVWVITRGSTIMISMYGIFAHMWLKFMVNVGKYSIHGSYG